jgi:hypothetical protein
LTQPPHQQQHQIQVGFSGRDGAVERLWATHVEANLYRLDNAPAFAFGISMHDVVEIYRDESGAAWAVRVARRGLVSTVRVVLDAQRPRSHRLMKTLAAIGCSSEGMNAVWFTVSAPDESSFERLVERLATDGYRWEYVNPQREDVASPDATASIERLIPPQINGSQQAFLHLHAPWKDRADDELEVLVEIEPGRVRSELLPARRIDEHRWELCSSPFLAENLALGDIVEVDASLSITRRVSRSGRATIAVFVADSARVEAVKACLEAVGCTVERRVRSGSLAVDCANAETFDRAQTWILAQEDIGFDVLQPPRRADDRDTA